jgi:hypothetical protein
VFQELDEWLRRRLRQLLWKRWKKPRARWRNLVALGVPPRSAREAAGSAKGTWRLSDFAKVFSGSSGANTRDFSPFPAEKTYAHLLSHVSTCATSPEQRLLAKSGLAEYRRTPSPTACDLTNRRVRDLHVRWCERGRLVTAPCSIVGMRPVRFLETRQVCNHVPGSRNSFRSFRF